MSINNPAGRLHKILRDMTSIKAEEQQKPAYETFRRLLCPNEYRAEIVLPRIVRVLELPGEIEKKIRSIPNVHHGHYLSWIPPVEQVFKSRNFDQKFRVFSTCLDANTLSLVGLCDDMLTTNAPEPVANQETINRMRDELIAFASEVRNADLDEQLREYVVHYIDLIDRALIDYNVQGIAAIHLCVEQAGGLLFTKKSMVDQVMKSPFKSTFASIFVGLTILCSGYPGARLIVADVKRLLPAFAVEAEIELKEETALAGAKMLEEDLSVQKTETEN